MYWGPPCCLVRLRHARVRHDETKRVSLSRRTVSLTRSRPQVLLSSYSFDAKYLLLGTQQAVCFAVCVALRRGASGIPGLEVPPFDFSAFIRFRGAGILFILNVIIGWYGLAVVNLPLFLCVRRTTVAFALVAEWLVLGSKQSPRVTASVCLIVVGAVIAGAGTFSADALGIAYTVGNNVATAMQLVLVKSASDATGVRGFGIVYYNSLWALPLCVIGATVTGEWRYAISHPALAMPAFWLALLAASSMGGLMTYTTILATTVAGPLATTVTGNVKDVVATLVGAAAFGDYTPTISSVTGILVSFAGAGWFTAEKLSTELRSGSGGGDADGGASGIEGRQAMQSQGGGLAEAAQMTGARPDDVVHSVDAATASDEEALIASIGAPTSSPVDSGVVLRGGRGRDIGSSPSPTLLSDPELGAAGSHVAGAVPSLPRSSSRAGTPFRGGGGSSSVAPTVARLGVR